MPRSIRALLTPALGLGLPVVLGLGLVLVAPALAAGPGSAPPSKLAAESWKQGLEAMKNKEWVECIEGMSQVIASDPEYVEAYLNLGYCQSEMRQWSGAVKTYERGLAHSPTDSLRFEILNALAFAQQSSEQFEAAIRTYEDLIKMRPNDKNVMVGYAFALKSLGRGVEAVMAYLRALELDPKDVAIIKDAGELCQRSDMFEQAIALYQRWTLIEPQNVEPHRSLAFLLYQAESCDRGVEAYEKVIALDSSNPGDLLNLGLLYQKCKQYDRALTMLQQYQAMRPDTTSAASAAIECRLAFLYEDMNKVADGIAFLNRAAEQHPDDPCLLYAWGRLLEQEGLELVRQEKFPDAVAAYRQAQAKLQPVVGNDQWGEGASKQLKRLEQLIKIAEAKRKQSEAE